MTERASAIPVASATSITTTVLTIKDIFLRILFPLVVWVVSICCLIPLALLYTLIWWYTMKFSVVLAQPTSMHYSEISKSTGRVDNMVKTCEKSTQYEKPKGSPSVFRRAWSYVTNIKGKGINTLNDTNKEFQKQIGGIKIFGTAKGQHKDVNNCAIPVQRAMTTLSLQQIIKSPPFTTHEQKDEKTTDIIDWDNFSPENQSYPHTHASGINMRSTESVADNQKENSCSSSDQIVFNADNFTDECRTTGLKMETTLEASNSCTTNNEAETEDEEMQNLEIETQKLQRQLEEEKRKQERIVQQQIRKKEERLRKSKKGFVAILNKFHKTANEHSKKFETWMDQPD